MRGRSRPQTRRRKTEPAFTLLELLIVMVIISIIVAFILTAATAGVRRAEERATQALIAKLDAGLADRFDAIMTERVDVNPAHSYLAGVFNSSAIPPWLPRTQDTRAQVLARLELASAELPDSFLVQGNSGMIDRNYPLNFGGAPFPSSAGNLIPNLAPNPNIPYSPYAHYMLPFGVAILNDPGTKSVQGTSYGANPPIPYDTSVLPPVAFPPVTPESTGIFGASYTASAGIYKNLIAAAIKGGATLPNNAPRDVGYNGVDDDGNGFVDDLGENGLSVQNAVLALLKNHTHKTARSEMLYALLVEGQGPLGSAFSADDFRDNEVRDTDGDGLPEFVDAWGEPIQFYRWPIGYSDDTNLALTLSTHGQKGLTGYQVFEPRQQNTLDPNQKLLDPSWWDGTYNDSSPFSAPQGPLSGSAFTVQTFFSLLIDPNANPGLPKPAPGFWDRGTLYPARRAFQSRYLILSGGPDKAPGVPVFDPTYYSALGDVQGTIVTGPSFSGASPVPIPTALSTSALSTGLLPLRVESQAAQATFLRSDYIYYSAQGPKGFPGSDPLSFNIVEAGHDDVTNHNLQGPGGATQ